MSKQKISIYEQVTAQIIDSLKRVKGPFQYPWLNAGLGLQVNAASKNAYNGANLLILMVKKAGKGFPDNRWATFRQWQDMGATVKKGERGTRIVFYQPIDSDDEDDTRRRKISRSYYVFNTAQVDGLENQKNDCVSLSENAETFIKNTGAKITHGPYSPCYISSIDAIRMPEIDNFVSTDTSTSTEGYYATVFHELIHWTRTKDRCDRPASKDFHLHVFEELVAELGSAFLCCLFNLHPQPRDDHAKYLKGWLEVLENDNRAIFKAAAEAQKAINYLKSLQPDAGNP